MFIRVGSGGIINSPGISIGNAESKSIGEAGAIEYETFMVTDNGGEAFVVTDNGGEDLNVR